MTTDVARVSAMPAVTEIPATATLTDAVLDHARTRPDAVLFRRRPVRPARESRPPGPAARATEPPTWTPITAAQFHAAVDALARGLLAAGLQPGARVALLSRTRYEWTLVDYALWHAGLITVPIYETSSPDQIGWILGDAQVAAAIVESPEHARVVNAVRDVVPNLQHIWVIEDGDLDRLTAQRASDDQLASARRELGAGSVATIVYTSGTTGRPKGCVLTHGNLLFAARSAVGSLPALFHEHTSALLFLPLAHVFAREIQVACVEAAVPVGHCPDTYQLQTDLASFRPTLLLAVPYLLEKVYWLAARTAEQRGTSRLFAAAVRTAQQVSAGPVTAAVRVRRALFDRLVYRRIRAALGGAVEWVVSGGAPLAPHLGHFFRGAGIPVLEGWGLTETTAAATVNRPDATKIGTVGLPLAGTEVGLTADGELLVRGGHVFAGYWGDPAATQEVLDADGWLHTGDLGEIDDDGFVTITGRRKEILVTAGGKNVAPAVLENRVAGHPLVAHCVVVGDGRPYVAALITLDPEAVDAWKQKMGKPASLTLAELRDDPDLVAEIQAAVDEANQAVSRAESIRRFRILDTEFRQDTGQLTPTLKVRRDVIAAQFAAEIDELYTRLPQPAPPSSRH